MQWRVLAKCFAIDHRNDHIHAKHFCKSKIGRCVSLKFGDVKPLTSKYYDVISGYFVTMLCLATFLCDPQFEFDHLRFRIFRFICPKHGHFLAVQDLV